MNPLFQLRKCTESKGGVGWRRCLALGTALLCAAGTQAVDVSWTGPDIGQWHVGSNWSGGSVPLPGDDVTINGASVGVTDERRIDGTFTLTNGAELRVSGEFGSFTATGETSINNGRLSVQGGALLDLSRATEYVWSLCEQSQIVFVNGEGSVLDLSGVQQLSMSVPSCGEIQSSMVITSGGLIDFSGLETISSPSAQTLAINLLVGGQMIAPNLSAITGTENALDGLFLLTGEGVALELPALTSMESTTLVMSGGTFTANGLVEAIDCLLGAGGDGTLSLDALETMRGGGLTIGLESGLTLPELTLLSDTFVLLSDLSVLNVPKLAVVEGVDDMTFFTAAGRVDLNAPVLATARNVAFAHTSLVEESTLDLTALRTYTWDLCKGGVPFTVSGAGATINASGLRTVSIAYASCLDLALGYNFGATLGGRLDLSGLTTVNAPLGQFVTFLAANAGTVIDVSSLVTFNPVIVSFFENDGGRIIRAGGGGGEGEGEGEGEGKLPGCYAGGPAGGMGAGDALLVLGLMGAIALSSRSRRYDAS